MDSTKTTYATFPFEWTVKSTSCQIQYRKAFNINEIDEIFCSIINAKGNEINFSELGILLGINLQDLAEIDIFKYYLKGLNEYNLIEVNEKEQIIQLTAFGQEAIQSNLKYKYYFTTTELYENQTATGETFDFSFKNVFDIENSLSHLREIKKHKLENPEVKKKLQFQLFGNDIFKGEIVELYEHEPRISYKTISLQTEITAFDNSLELSIFKSGANKPEVQFLIGLPENTESKSKLLRKGMYHHILSVKTSITKQDIESYVDLWNWKELAGNPKLDWYDNTIFELFRENGDGGIWSIISEKAPIESIKSVIEEYADYWNWSTLTERFDDEFIKEQIEKFDWDFEELSYKEIELVTSLLSNLNLKEKGWDWNYLSKSLPDKFIEERIEDFPWDFYVITESKNEVFKNTFIKYRDKLETLILKNWNWKFISEEINLNFLYKNISGLACKLNWHTVLNRFFLNEELTAKCLNDESFKTLLKQHLPENFVVAHQKYLWTPNLIDFFENLNLIQWETQKYIIGFDTNENVEWSKPVFQKYQNHITTENGFLNVSKQISDYNLISEFPDFAWNWEGISKNKNLISDATFIEKSFTGELPFSNNLLWNEILSQSTIDVSFWNKNLDAFYKATESEKQIQFWNTLTQKEKTDFVFANSHFPWDWTFITENSTEETILDSFDDIDLLEKWDWRIATRKLEKETVLDFLEELARFIDWKFLITEVFIIESELAMDKQLPRIAACLSFVNNELRKDIWRALTIKFPFEILFPIVKATHSLDLFEWDWDYISNHKFFPTDIATLNLFQKKINWSILSESNAIQKKFNPKSWNTGKEWFSNIDRYLQKFDNNWDWKVLSKNRNINYNRLLLQKYKGENWDWDYLTEFGGFLLQQKRDNEKYLEQVLKQFQKIKYDILSNRKDIFIDIDLIRSTKDKNWDWQVLSENEKAEISNELILELKNKNWNWQALSKRKDIEFSNETLLQLLDKDWDWHYLSDNTNLEFTAQFIEKTRAKSWKWKLVSRHKSFSPSVEILTLTKDFDLDWQYISKHSSLTPTTEILAKFENKWHWQSITENPQINFDDIDFLERFADRWNWHFICESGKLALNNQILNKFKEYLEWDLISSNTNLNFTREIIQEFKQYWNWSRLKVNKRVEELLGSYVTDEINKNATLNFIDKIEQQWSEWKGSIYHFSHIDNAVGIIKNRKIQSRNKAVKTSDSAGRGVIDLRHDAHDYARFYFRPHTPTQFYNEFLGKNKNAGYNNKNLGWVSWYEKARGLGFPKCPVPIFFRFSLKEVLFENENKCCISNGNMQTSSTKFGSIDKMIDKFGFEDLYYTPQQFATKEDYNRYRNYAQQEFLVKDELSFNDLSEFEIVCPSEADKTLLINLLGNEHKDIFSKIVVDRRYYNNENPRVRIEEEDSELHISTNFSGEGYFVLNGTSDIKEMEILVGDVTKTSKDKIIFKSNISLGNVKQNIQLNFIDESNRSWFVYQISKWASPSNSKNVLKSNENNIIEFVINSEISKKLSYQDYADILDMQGFDWNEFSDNYNPAKIYKRVFNKDFDLASEIDIACENIHFLVLTSWNNQVYQEVTKCKNLIAIYKLDISDIPLDHIEYLSNWDIEIVHDGWSDWFFFAGQLFYHKILEITSIKDYQPNRLIDYLMRREPFSSSLNSKVRHYVLKEHTLLVCHQFESYFGNFIDISYKPFMRFMLAIHDLGKGKLANNSDTSLQYFNNKNIINLLIRETQGANVFDDLKLKTINFFITHDTLGSYFQEKLTLIATKKAILNYAEETSIDSKYYFYLLMVYYQCDIAAYTADGGGIKFLEHLFEYENGEKVFDEKEGLLKMSPKYWEMYKQLKNDIENGY
jgi:hypothetical protein